MFVPRSGPMPWKDPEVDEDGEQLDECHTSMHMEEHFIRNMPNPPMPELLQLAEIDKLKFHAHFDDVSGMHGTQERREES